MPNLFLVRPGLTDAHDQELLLGRSDLSLNEKGLSQSLSLAETLGGWPIDRVIVSPEKRSFQSVTPLCDRLSLIPIRRTGLQAIDYGEWELHALDEIRTQDGARFEQFWLDPSFPAPGGESLKDAKRRLWPEMTQAVAEGMTGETVLIAAPGKILSLFLCEMLGAPESSLTRFQFEPASLTVLKRPEPEALYRILSFNLSSAFQHDLYRHVSQDARA
jgi:broad specificity phosphatase PhoE